MKMPTTEKEAFEMYERENPWKERERRVAAAMETLKLAREKQAKKKGKKK